MAFVPWSTTTGCFDTSLGKDAVDVASIKCLEPLFKNAVFSLLGLVGIGLFVMLLIAGFTFLFSAGDPKKLEAARGTLTNAVIGLVVIVTAYLILLVIRAFTGVDVTIFRIPQ